LTVCRVGAIDSGIVVLAAGCTVTITCAGWNWTLEQPGAWPVMVSMKVFCDVTVPAVKRAENWSVPVDVKVTSWISGGRVGRTRVIGALQLVRLAVIVVLADWLASRVSAAGLAVRRIIGVCDPPETRRITGLDAANRCRPWGSR